jgi:mannose-6-phosphate isomerase-like protein (cupin superfamily)
MTKAPVIPLAAGLLLAGLTAVAQPDPPPGRDTTARAAEGRAPRAVGERSAPVFDALLADRLSLALDELPGRVALAPEQDFRVIELGRDAHTSHHVVAIRNAEVPHRHDHHDLLVVMLRGYGQMRLGAETRPVGAGSILYVPRATVHAFTNASGEPAVAYAVYTPAFDGQDRIPVE